MKKYLIIFILFFVGSVVYSQEVLINCGNPFLKKYSKEYFEKNSNTKSKSAIPIELPFFDDFSNSFVYPDSERWIDKYAFINNDYAIDPISIGVATLDAIDEHGTVYPGLPSSGSKVADYLTSQPINLNYQPSDSIYFSFYYQAGGKGNVPEVHDSLVLQFYTSENDEWHSIICIEGGNSMDYFKLVHIPVLDEKFLKNDFQFRFLNYASISSNQEPSWKSNSDMWNIDYVKLDKNRSYKDTLANDVAFIYNFKSLIQEFESVPWKHYKKTQTNIMFDNVEFVYKNTWDVAYNIERNFFIYDFYNSSLLYRRENDSENIEGDETINYPKEISYRFPGNLYEDSAKFIIMGHISTDTEADRQRYRWNDTIRYYQTFDNYYAYDDGTAEAGYGVIGSQASVAYKFTPLADDTLKGVYIFFNQVVDQANRKNFYLTVWDDNNGYPGEVLHEIEGTIPKFGDKVNQYIYYPLDEHIRIRSTFYIGWRKTTNDVLNCGFDINRNPIDKLYYNVSGVWEKSQFQGALMIRPVFGREPNTSSANENFANIDFEIFPNPANNILNISSDQIYEYYEICDTWGKVIMNGTYIQKINTSNLPQGMYFIQLKSRNKVSQTKKFMIIR